MVSSERCLPSPSYSQTALQLSNSTMSKITFFRLGATAGPAAVPLADPVLFRACRSLASFMITSSHPAPPHGVLRRFTNALMIVRYASACLAAKFKPFCFFFWGGLAVPPSPPPFLQKSVATWHSSVAPATKQAPPWPLAPPWTCVPPFALFQCNLALHKASSPSKGPSTTP